MLFGLLFLAVAIMSLLILFNQGQLVKNRVQLENAADAAVYSQALLGARNQNFIAYTNRAMVANEVSIGQMVALLSWAKHYKNVGAFLNFPLYNIPIVPPAPVTYRDVLSVITLPYRALGTAVAVPTDVMVSYWPTVVSYFNSAVGLFQKMFALSTLEAQVEINLDVVKDHEDDPNNPQMYTPVVGWFFFTTNALLTYFGDNFDPGNLADLVSDAESTDSVDEQELVADFLADQVGEVETMINNNTPGRVRKSTRGGKDANLNAGEEEDEAIAAYQRYAAIVNANREGFTEDRHWDIGVQTPDLIPRLSFDLGVLAITLDLDLSFWTGVRNDGGAAYVGNDLEVDADIPSLGWSAIDVTSFGIEFFFNLLFQVDVCLFGGCSRIIDVEFGGRIPIGFPLAGATHQLVSENRYAENTMFEWANLGDVDTGMWGGDPDDPLNQGAFDPFHTVSLLWGQAAPELLPGMYGANRARDVTDSYGAPPSFYSLGDSFQEGGRSYEYTIALTKSLDNIQTTDNEVLGIEGDESDWDSGDIDHTRFDVQTSSRAQAGDLSGDYQQAIWGNRRPMMTISSAETYFANPMQSNEDGSAEPASLFSPFWDARLREPSAIAILIATGEIDWEEVIDGLSGGAVDIVEWLLNAVGDRVVESGVEYLTSQMEPPFDTLLEGPVTDAASEVKDAAVSAVVDELDDYLP
ncbi:MAG: hypothetical protein ACSHXK_14555 [Oceanococcus sp.]